jgi:DNA-binding MarR family transcriptional regulator
VNSADFSATRADVRRFTSAVIGLPNEEPVTASNVHSESSAPPQHRRKFRTGRTRRADDRHPAFVELSSEAGRITRMRPTSIEPRWLNAEQQVIWRQFLSGTGRISAELDAELRQFGLDLGEYEILVHLSENPHHELRMSELADRVRQSRSRLTHTVSRMEAKNILTRIACPSDRRGVIAKLTDEGYALLVEAAPHHVESVRRVLVDVVDAKDFAALGRLMTAVVEAPEQR